LESVFSFHHSLLWGLVRVDKSNSQEQMRLVNTSRENKLPKDKTKEVN
jgi:hypothetical protein